MKYAFSLLESIFVLIILALIISLAQFYPSNENKIYLGAKQIVNDLHYARALALMQESFRDEKLSVATKDEWFKARWQLYFIRSKSATNNEQTYTLFLDKNGDGNANIGKINVNIDREIAVDLFNPKKLMNSGQSGVINAQDEKASQRFNIQKTFGILRVEFKDACAGSTRVIFDEFGRLYSPLRGANQAFDKLLIHKNKYCIIKLINQTQSVCILIDTLSGYAFLPALTRSNTQYIAHKQKLCSQI
ncbi:prepilin-type cleavage/methylation domain-containing protein [Campylobacter sp. MIT 19-121]|uniref:prepilin-type cleavage/methylation domain-containing protein n=1 Tax=Campylobacter sp. MIT 19-121 TaxID=2703906 RepID=UPI00138A0930|nr:prepilin-type cleavage/methylation domain-containing protein [Campylobacter sp. MIT 19-121]